MASCLGIYIEENLIKYAKVSKDKENIKVDAFGIKFYDKLGDSIKQIIAETFSYKIPISINLSEEMYNYFFMFKLLNKKDLTKSIATEFESYCFEKGYNKNIFETRYAIVNLTEDKDRVKTIHIATNKAEITRKNQDFEGYSLNTISPVPICIANNIEVKKEENSIILNIENKTTVTTIIGGSIYNVDKLEVGMGEILYNINLRENSFAKAYEVCKNTTIYTSEGKELQLDENENEYLEDIVTTLYKIVEALQEIIDTQSQAIDKIYITGTGSIINNIDLYFQEYFLNSKCEILKPYFAANNMAINIRDYVEVNSAIALALQGLGFGLQDMNFKKTPLLEGMKNLISENVKIDKNGNIKNALGNFSQKLNLNKNIKFDLNEKLDAMEMWLLRVAGGLLVLNIIYASMSAIVISKIEKKVTQVEEVKTYTNTQIASVDKDISKLEEGANQYVTLKSNLEAMNKKLSEKLQTRNRIPTLLSKIMYEIPQHVTLTSIKNTSDNKITIEAQSAKYEYIGYFISQLKLEGILSNVYSTSGVKQDGVIKVTIEGEMP